MTAIFILLEQASKRQEVFMIRYGDYISPEEYLELRKTVGWRLFPLGEAKNCVENAYMVLCARDGQRAVGVVRLSWDGGYVAFLSDLIVAPEYQGQGIGKKLVEAVIQRIRDDMKPGYIVNLNLNSAKGKEPFYAKLGFVERPNEEAGAGMNQWLVPEDQI